LVRGLAGRAWAVRRAAWVVRPLASVAAAATAAALPPTAVKPLGAASVPASAAPALTPSVFVSSYFELPPNEVVDVVQRAGLDHRTSDAQVALKTCVVCDAAQRDKVRGPLCDTAACRRTLTSK
jgi:hypothetical protein